MALLDLISITGHRWISSFLLGRCNLNIVSLANLCCATWKLRNKHALEIGKKPIISTAELICYACCVLKCWAGL